MKDKRPWKRHILLTGMMLLFLVGCMGQPSAPTRFYTLNSSLDTEVKLKFAERDQYKIIEIDSIEFPAYLDRPQLVIRQSQHEYVLAEFDHWAEPLKGNFERVFVENLNKLLNDAPVAVVTWRSYLKVDYQLRITVIRLESDRKGNVVLEAGWGILGDDGRKLILAKVSNIKVQSESEDFQEIVAAQSRAVETLSEEIAEAIKTISQQEIVTDPSAR